MLKGGPMNGWVVKQGAPVLNPGWYETWPPALSGGRAARMLHGMGIHRACRNHPGRYVVTGAQAEWRDL